MSCVLVLSPHANHEALLVVTVAAMHEASFLLVLGCLEVIKHIVVAFEQFVRANAVIKSLSWRRLHQERGSQASIFQCCRRLTPQPELRRS